MTQIRQSIQTPEGLPKDLNTLELDKANLAKISQAKAKSLGRLLGNLCNQSIESFLEKASPEALRLAKAETLALAKELIAMGADVNEDPAMAKKNHVPHSPLISAARHNNLEMVKLLVSCGARVTPQAMQAAALSKNPNLVEFLLQKGGKAYHFGELDIPVYKVREDFPDVTPIHDVILYYAEMDPELTQTPPSNKTIKTILKHYKIEELKNAEKNGDLRKDTRRLVKEELLKRKVKGTFKTILLE